MPDKTKKRTQVSVSLNEMEKTVLSKQSFRQNRSVSQIMRFDLLSKIRRGPYISDLAIPFILSGILSSVVAEKPINQ